MGLFGPTSGGSTPSAPGNTPLLITSADQVANVLTAPENQLFLINASGTIEIAASGQPWLGSRTFFNAGAQQVSLSRTNASFYTNLGVGEVITLTFNGTSFTGARTAINHTGVVWSSNTTIPDATPTTRGILPAIDKVKLDSLINAASLSVNTWIAASSGLTINTTQNHGLKVGQQVVITGIPSANTISVISVDQVLSDTSFRYAVAYSPQTGTGGSVFRGGLMSPNDKNKLDSVNTTQINADWAATSGVAQIFNKPTIPAAQVQSDWNATTGVAAIANKPTIPAAQVASDWSATSGVTQILNKPTIPAAPVNADWNSTSGLSQILNKPNIPSKVAFGPMVILRFANWLRGSTGYGPGNPPTGMTTLTPKSGNVVENFNPDIYNPRLFNAGEFFGVGRQYKLICAVRCTNISFDGVHCQLRWFNGTTSQIIPGLMDFGGGNDGIDEKSYWATSDTLTAANEWWSFVPFFGAYNTNNGARIQDCVVIAHLV